MATARGADRILWMDGTVKPVPAVPRRVGFLVYFLLAIVLIGVSLFYVWSRIQVIQVGYEISNALKEGKAFHEANKKLRVEIATLKSYARIERVAGEELKMSKPGPGQVIVIR